MPPGDVRHVLMTADAVGGVWTYAIDLAEALGRRGIRVSLVVFGPSPSTSQRRLAAALPFVELFDRPYRLEWMDDPWRDVEHAGCWLLELESALKPDVVHLNGYTHAPLKWRAPVVVAGHSCVLSWWQAVHKMEPPDRYSRYAREVARGIAAADLLVTPSTAMMAALERHYGRSRWARVIANGRRIRHTTRKVKKEPFILAAGRLWDPAKNIGAVMAVAGNLPWPVYVAGDAHAPDGERMRLAGVGHLGVLPSHRLAAWMRRACMFVAPARYEPFGLAILEAAMARCALVLGDIDSLRELWDEAALFVPPDDHDALRATLHTLIAQPSLRRQLASAACRRGSAMTAARMANHYCRAYEDVRRADGARLTA